MKKWRVLVVFACVVAAVQAGEGDAKKSDKKGSGGDVSKAQFVANQKKSAEKKGVEFDRAKAEAKFDKMDKNGDGILTADEKSQGKNKDKNKDKKKAENKESAE